MTPSVEAPQARASAPPTPVEAVAALPATERDDDRVLDRDLACLDVLEGSDAASGCVAHPGLVVEGDHFILDDAVAFDTGRAKVHAEGRALIRTIARAARRHPEWQAFTVEGHADVRGSDAFNQWLSEVRAANVRTTLVRAGFPADRVTAIGYGRSRPRDPRQTSEAYRRNRRVEFVIERGAR